MKQEIKNSAKAAFKLTIPILFGYVALGIAFGLLMAEKHFPLWLTPLMSSFVFTGAGQYVAVGLMAANTPLGTILVTEAFVGIRHIVYGLSLISKYENTGKWKPYLIFALSDETYALTSSTQVPENCHKPSFYGFISLFDQSYWIFGTVLGHVLGLILQNTTNLSLEGIDFALTALFAVILVDQIRSTKDWFPPVIGVLCTLTAVILWKFNVLPDSSSILLVSLAAGVSLIALFRRPNKNSVDTFTAEEKSDE